MRCSDFEAAIVELARGAASPESERHAEECPRCRERLRLETRLTAGLREVQQELTLQGPSPSIQNALLGELRKPRHSRVSPWVWAAAAAVLLGLAGALAPSPEPAPPVPARASNPFVLLDYSRPITAADTGRMIRVTLPGSAPATLGFPVVGAGRVEADILLGEDGSARAIRFIDYDDF